MTINLSSNSSAVTVPASAAAGVNATSVSFPVTTGAFTTSQAAVVSAAIGTAGSVSATISLLPSASNTLLTINGVASEVSGVSNGATITPTVAPSGMTGQVVVNGNGSANFVAGSGVYFLNCCSNSNNAYYKFTGSPVGSVFNLAQGEISFTLTSRYTFAQRLAAYAQHYAFDVRDGNGTHQFYFLTQIAPGGYLEFAWMIAGTGQYYYVPQGTEDQLFGNGVSLNVMLKWDGSTTGLYLNGALAKSTPETAATPNWNAGSNFDLGAYEYLTFGGYNSSDDSIGNFNVTQAAASGSSAGGATGPTTTTSTTPAILQINATASEVSGVSNGATITPTVAPSGMTGQVVVNGNGSANFVAGSGVYFLNCCSNSNNAYYKFTGSPVGSVFNLAQGEISFTLTSRYSFAQRLAAYAQHYAFDVRDGNGTHQFYFLTQIAPGGYLEFVCMVAGTGQYYYVPQGTEDQLFGNGVSLNVTLKWDGSTTGLYLNGALVKSTPQTAATPNWNAGSNFDLGAYEYLTFGGYNSSDDVIGNFKVQTAAQGSPAGGPLGRR